LLELHRIADVIDLDVLPGFADAASAVACAMVYSESPLPLSTMARESTRNGMSSVTTSTTVRGDCQPSRARSGLNTRTSAWPGLRFAPKRRWPAAAAASVAGSVARKSLSSTPRK
jgi:hypothetical protein